MPSTCWINSERIQTRPLSPSLPAGPGTRGDPSAWVFLIRLDTCINHLDSSVSYVYLRQAVPLSMLTQKGTAAGKTTRPAPRCPGLVRVIFSDVSGIFRPLARTPRVRLPAGVGAARQHQSGRRPEYDVVAMAIMPCERSPREWRSILCNFATRLWLSRFADSLRRNKRVE